MELKLLVTLQSDTDTDAKNSRKLIELKMKRLTTKEKEIMELYWQHGPLFVKELLEYYDEPRPHFNTLSTTVRILPHHQRTGIWPFEPHGHHQELL